MTTSRLLAKAILAAVLGATANTAVAGSCTSTIEEAIKWLGTKDPTNTYSVGFTMSQVKGPDAKFVSSTTGTFVKNTSTSIKTSAAQFFSDRGSCPDLPPRTLCIPPGYVSFDTLWQPFDYLKTDDVGLTLSTSGTGTLTVVLESWGNATYNVALQCTDGLLYGIMTEPNGQSLLGLSLNLYKTPVP